jgi:MFS family permease
VLTWTTGEIVNGPVASARWAEFAPAHARGRYASAYSFTWAMAGLLGGLIGGYLFAWRPVVLWGSCGLLGLVAAALALASGRRSPTTPAGSVVEAANPDDRDAGRGLRPGSADSGA